MEKAGRDKLFRAVRRGAALGLILTAVWCVGLSVDFGGAGDGLSNEARGNNWAAKLLQSILEPVSGQSMAMKKRGSRLLLKCNPILAAGEQDVISFRAAQKQPPQGENVGEHTILHDNDDQTEPDLKHHGDGSNIIEITAKGKNSSQYIWGDGVCLYNRTKMEMGKEILSQGTIKMNMGEGPQILIIHTHGTEAYSQSDGDTYQESDPYRTTDCTHNVVKVGEEIATVFRAHGFQVIHDPSLHDYPAYNGSYDRSKAAVEQWLAQYPTIQMVLDIHRDALVGKDEKIYKLVSEEAGEKVAQVMFVIGSSDAGMPHPGWPDNLALAVRLQQGLMQGYTNLARPIVLRSNRYNQQLLPGYLLVEIGGHGNTLSEAVAGARLWADNVARTLLSISKPKT